MTQKFIWPKGTPPNEERWLKCIDLFKEVCGIENRILQRKVNLSHAQRAAGLKGGRKRNERQYQIVIEMSEEGKNNKQIAKRLGITLQRLYEFRSKHKI